MDCGLGFGFSARTSNPSNDQISLTYNSLDSCLPGATPNPKGQRVQDGSGFWVYLCRAKLKPQPLTLLTCVPLCHLRQL